jgi:uncharacterized membrane protein YheB (UPF0754 family)
MKEFFSHPDVWLYLLIPVINAIVGWGTNVLALKMTFYPLDFIGIPPYLGWQGIIPSKAGVMAGKSVDLITEKLISVEERFANIEPAVVVNKMQPEIEKLSHRVINEVMESQTPLLWLGLPGPIKANIYAKASKDLPGIVEEMIQEIKDHITELFDLKHMVIKTLVNNKALLNEIFIKCGEKEFKFIERSGLYFGFIFGLIQMIIWWNFQPWWLLPLAGLFVGYATNWLALKLIFNPLNPIRIGPWVFQGVFLKRQKEVANAYSELVAEEIMNSRNIFDTILHGNASGKLIQIIREHVSRAVETTAGNSKELLQFISGKDKFETAKNVAASGVIEDIRVTTRQLYEYTEEALDMENTLKSRMVGLPPAEFQGFLRPAFQEDEFKLILVGAFLGFLAGLGQLLILFN